jgi:hypothetical protein
MVLCDGLTWALARDLSNTEVEARMLKVPSANEPPERLSIDFECVHREMKHVRDTLQALPLDYQEG